MANVPFHGTSCSIWGNQTGGNVPYHGWSNLCGGSPNHIYDMAAVGGYTEVDSRVATLIDKGGITPKVDFANSTAIERPLVATGPVMEFNGSEYLRATGHADIISGNAFRVNVRVMLDVSQNNGVFGVGPSSGGGRFLIYARNTEAFRVEAYDTTNTLIIRKNFPALSLSTWYDLEFSLHDNVIDYSVDGSPVSTGVAFDMSTQDTTFDETFLGARNLGRSAGFMLNGKIENLTLMDLR